MRSAKELLLASKAYTSERRAISWWHFLSTLMAFAALIALTLLDLPWPVRLAASFVAGLVHVRLFVIYHDYQHGAILRGSRLAAAAMHVYGFFALNPPSLWNHGHNHHHKHNAKIIGAGLGSYPVMTTGNYNRASSRQRLAYAISRHPATIMLGYVTIFLYALCLRPFLRHPRKHWDGGVTLLLHAALAMALAAWRWDALVLSLLLPALVGSALGAYLFYAQHNYPAVKLREGADWSYADAALHSSSYIPMGRFMCWFTGNIGYHHVHHLNSRIPFYRLPEAMAGIPELQTPGVTALSPRDILQCLKLKLWDAEQDRLVPFPRVQ